MPSAFGAWQTTQRGLTAGFGIASDSAILADRAVVSVAYERECTSRCDQVTNWLFRSPAPPWQPLDTTLSPAPEVVQPVNSLAQVVSWGAEARGKIGPECNGSKHVRKVVQRISCW